MRIKDKIWHYKHLWFLLPPPLHLPSVLTHVSPSKRGMTVPTLFLGFPDAESETEESWPELKKQEWMPRRCKWLWVTGRKEEGIEVKGKGKKSKTKTHKGWSLERIFSDDFEIGALSHLWTWDILKQQEWGQGGFKEVLLWVTSWIPFNILPVMEVKIQVTFKLPLITESVS